MQPSSGRLQEQQGSIHICIGCKKYVVHLQTPQGRDVPTVIYDISSEVIIINLNKYIHKNVLRISLRRNQYSSYITMYKIQS